jgi:hypothetical protein
MDGGDEFILGRNVMIIIVMVELASLCFGLMNTVSLSGIGQVNPAIAQVNSQLSGINATVSNFLSSQYCTKTPSLASCSVSSNSILLPVQYVRVINAFSGFFTAIAYIFIFIGQSIYLLIYMLTGFFPLLFSAGVFGAAYGVLFGIIFDAASIIMLLYLLSLIINRMPLFGKH